MGVSLKLGWVRRYMQMLMEGCGDNALKIRRAMGWKRRGLVASCRSRVDALNATEALCTWFTRDLGFHEAYDGTSNYENSILDAKSEI